MSDRLEVSSGVVHPWHHDIFGHMNVRHYAGFFDDASFLMWTRMGFDLARMQEEHGAHTVTAKAVTNFVRELSAGDVFRIDAAVSRLGGKSVTFELRMIHLDTGEVHATYETVEVFFDPKTRASTAMPDSVREKLQDHVVG